MINGSPTLTPERRFGIHVPRHAHRAPFRVLVGWRWLVASLGLCLSIAGVGWRTQRWWRLLSAGVVAVGGLLGVAVATARLPRFGQLDLVVANLPPDLDGVKIVHLGDLHYGLPFTTPNLRRARTWLATQRPDLILFSGDFVDELTALPRLVAQLRQLHAPYGMFAVFGNHDYWAGAGPLVDALAQCGIEVLRNQHRVVCVGDTPLVVAGLDSVWMQRHDLAATLHNLLPGVPVVLLAHEPDIADDVAQAPVVLQLSGHTHAGHIALPGLGPLFLPRHGFRYVHGLHRVGKLWVFVTSGLGGLPIRIGSRPQATLIVLRAGK